MNLFSVWCAFAATVLVFYVLQNDVDKRKPVRVVTSTLAHFHKIFFSPHDRDAHEMSKIRCKVHLLRSKEGNNMRSHW